MRREETLGLLVLGIIILLIVLIRWGGAAPWAAR